MLKKKMWLLFLILGLLIFFLFAKTFVGFSERGEASSVGQIPIPEFLRKELVEIFKDSEFQGNIRYSFRDIYPAPNICLTGKMSAEGFISMFNPKITLEEILTNDMPFNSFEDDLGSAKVAVISNYEHASDPPSDLLQKWDQSTIGCKFTKLSFDRDDIYGFKIMNKNFRCSLIRGMLDVESGMCVFYANFSLH